MTLSLLIGIGVLGGAGAVGRFLLDGQVSRRVGREFPYGTLAVNLSGSLLLGLLVGIALGSEAGKLAGTGLVGGFTTFSTWSLESHRLGEDGRWRSGVANFLISLIAGVAAAWAGRWLGGRL